MESEQNTTIPKRSCLITLMFPIDDDAQAMHVKKIIDEATKNIKEKRYSFQINET